MRKPLELLESADTHLQSARDMPPGPAMNNLATLAATEIALAEMGLVCIEFETRNPGVLTGALDDSQDA